MCSLLLIPLLTASLGAQEWADQLKAKTFESDAHGAMQYRLFAPRIKDGQKLPLVLFLHGAGERGNDNRRQLRHGVSDFVSAENQAKRPCFVVAPQCPRRTWWDIEQLLALTEAVIAEHDVDPDRVYITGLSMGGYGTWHAIGTRPELFAAAVPICGGCRGGEEMVEKMKDVPIWAFHGGADGTVPPRQSRRMIKAIEKAGGAPKYTEYEGVRHNSWTRTYADQSVHEWLFAQRRSGTPAAAPKALVNGDRVVFFGDSITQAGARKGGYIRLVEAAAKELRPKLDVAWVPAGISGHKVPDLQKRLERDVLSKKPSIVIIYIGINDVWHWSRDRGTEKDVFDKGLRELIAKIQAVDARVIMCTPSVIGEKLDGKNHFDKMLDEYSAISRRVAADTGSQMLDLRQLFVDYITAHNEKDADRGILTGDTVHLNAKGNRFVADRMLEAMGFELTGK